MDLVPASPLKSPRQMRVPREMRRRVYAGLACTAAPLAPLASFLLWRQYLLVGNLSSLWMCIAYAILSLSLIASLALLWAKRLDASIACFAYPAALMLAFQLAVSPSVIIGVTFSEMALLLTIGFVVMETEHLKLFAATQGVLVLASLFLRSAVMPVPIAFPEWELFNRQIVPLAIFLVFQLAVIFMALYLNRLLGSLNEQREELATKNEDLRLFFYAASHDLRQPIRQISSFSRLLEQRHKAELAEEAKEYLGFIEQVAARMEGLLDALLAFSSLGGITLRRESVALGAVLTRALEAQKLDLDEVKGRLQVDGELPLVQGQASLLEDLFKNLIENCIKYRHPERPLLISVGAKAYDRGWLLQLDDNGIGVPENVTEGLFKVFHRGHPQAHYPGYGIGLAYCRRVVEMHGGWIRYEPKAEPGARFVLYIPALLPGLSSH